MATEPELFGELMAISRGIYARRVTDGSGLGKLFPCFEYNGTFDFNFINDCGIPKNADLREHEMAWSLFERDFRREWKKFVNSNVRTTEG